MTLNHNKLGGALLAASPIFVNLAKDPALWWVGIFCAAIGPILLAIEKKA